MRLRRSFRSWISASWISALLFLPPLSLVAGSDPQCFGQAARRAALRQQIVALSKECRCRLGFAAVMVEDPATLVAVSDGRPYPTASTYKLAIATAYLLQVEAGRHPADEDITISAEQVESGVSRVADEAPRGGTFTARRLLGLMITESDNTASDAILRQAGGPAAVTALLREHGVEGIVVGTPETEMSTHSMQNHTTPEAMVGLLTRIYLSDLLPAGSTRFLIRQLQATTTFPGRIKGMLPPETVVGHKTGTGNTVNGVTWATNDVGVVTLPDGQHLALAVYECDSAESESVRDKVIARAARAAYDCFAPKGR